MTDKELQRLGRRELLEMLIAQSRELKALQEKYDEAEKALQSKAIAINSSGSIAEAALKLNGVFEAAQAACRQYVDNITGEGSFDKAVFQPASESREEAQRIIREAQEEKARMLLSAEHECAEMRRAAEQETQKYWDEVAERLNSFAARQSELDGIIDKTNK